MIATQALTECAIGLLGTGVATFALLRAPRIVDTLDQLAVRVITAVAPNIRKENRTVGTTTNVADVLDSAASVIDRNGWTQGDIYDNTQAAGADGRNCRVDTIGAINTVVYGSPQYPRHATGFRHIADAAVQSVREHLGIRGTVADWNDTPGRTAAEVTRAMRGAAADLRRAAA